MNKQQYDMFCKLIKNSLRAKVGDYTFVISNRINEVFDLSQYYKGTRTVLKVGTITECVDAAKDCVQMMYGIEG